MNKKKTGSSNIYTQYLESKYHQKRDEDLDNISNLLFSWGILVDIDQFEV